MKRLLSAVALSLFALLAACSATDADFQQAAEEAVVESAEMMRSWSLRTPEPEPITAALGA